MLRTLLLSVCLALASGFTVAPALTSRRAASTTVVMMEGRRGVVAALGAAAVATLPFTQTAFADSIEEIAARSNAAAKAAAEAKAEEVVVEPDNKSSLNLILAIAGGGTLASTAFYTQNLKRLGEKVVSGKGRKY